MSAEAEELENKAEETIEKSGEDAAAADTADAAKEGEEAVKKIIPPQEPAKSG